jgi:pyruvate kinase
VIRDSTAAAAIAAVQASYSTRASAIIGLTTTGKTAHIASKYRALCPFLAVTRNAQAARQMQLFRGVVPLFYSGKICEIVKLFAFFKKRDMYVYLYVN